MSDSAEKLQLLDWLNEEKITEFLLLQRNPPPPPPIPPQHTAEPGALFKRQAD